LNKQEVQNICVQSLLPKLLPDPDRGEHLCIYASANDDDNYCSIV